MRRTPGFTFIATVTLALGIGSTTAVFSVVNGVLFRPLPFPEPQELTVVWADWSRAGGPADEWVNFPNYHDLKGRSQTLQAVAAWGEGSLTLTGRAEPEQLVVGSVSPDMFSDVLRVSPALGRGFEVEDGRPDAPGTVILTDGFWRRAFGTDPTIIGSALVLNDELYEVIGVMAPDFASPFATDAEIWTARREDISTHACGRGGACLRAVARLAPGVTLTEARADAEQIAGQLALAHPETNRNIGFTLRPLRDDLVADSRTGLIVLLSAAGFVLLIACVNIANLLMARASTRATELAVRSALGAGRRRLITQLLTESALLAMLGGALGLGVAAVGTDTLIFLAPAGVPRIDSVSMDASVLAFAVAATATAGLLFGVVPAIRTTRHEIEPRLREGGRDGTLGVLGTRVRGALVAGQIAIAIVLLIGAGLLLQTFHNLRSRDLGYRPEGVLTLQIGLPSSRYPDPPALRGFLQTLEERLMGLPGVTAIGSTSWLPLTGFGSDTDFTIEGQPLPPPGQNQNVWFRRITPGYPAAMGMTLVAGRWLTAQDDENAPRVVVINDGLARRFFAGVDPLGQRINLGNPAAPEWRDIVGVAAEGRYFGVRDDSRDALYLPYAQAPSRTVFVALRSGRELSALSGELRGVVAELDPRLAVARITPMQSLVTASLGPDRFVTALMALFAGAAVTLAVVGLYGVVAYAVRRRLREVAVRVALGAQHGDIRWLVLRGAAGPVAVGLTTGLLAALLLTRMLETLLFGVSAVDPWTYGTVALALAGVAIAATVIPARRAARTDPTRILRAE